MTGVDAGSRIIEHKDTGIEQKCTSNSHTLLLTAGKRHTTLANPGIIAIGQGGDEVVQAGKLRCRDDLLCSGVGCTISDILAQRGVKEENILQDQPYITP